MDQKNQPDCENQLEEAGSRENVPQNGTSETVKQPSEPPKQEVTHNLKRSGGPVAAQTTTKRKKLFLYGNYDRYYGYRNNREAPKEDARLPVFIEQRAFIEGKRMLDIGCNNGSLTLLIAEHCRPASVVGIDIDRNLIGAARNNLALRRRTCDSNALKNVQFRHINYVYADEVLLECEKPQYDVIFCLSVTKWIQLNFGDAGVKLAFRRAYRQLHPGGRFVLEPQPWDSYKHRRKLSPEIAENFRAIQFRPDAFREYLLGDEVGFREVTELKVPTSGGGSKGFRRPIYVFLK
uniref:RNA methyltransferase n=1 Tax=Culex tarsalis TaxID=7177 RepID=A0A1Q3EW69_CULTA